MGRARSFGAVPCRLWRASTYRGMTQQAKLLYLFLLTCEHANASGVFRLPVAYAAADTGMAVEEIELAHAELAQARMATRCEDWVVVHNRLADDPPPNPKTFSAVCSQINEAINDAPAGLPLRGVADKLIELDTKFPGVMPDWLVDKVGEFLEGSRQ